ncbi:MAG: bifunctional glycosyltransferase family 2/GtrA family protein [Oscillospiraceae bacterium]|jgi:glycosyltransferase involved in cell wall biosynthesis|nr:bifunctional glycosyltransferase family 2/GtrA family protein [Oscillospiraceae bacterium]
MLSYKKNIAVIIPSFDPDDKLLKVVSDLVSADFKNIIVVNDGSKNDTVIYFDKVRKICNCKVISHSVNLGKGRALKNAFNFILTELPDITHLVTIDSDGQHSVEDVENCCETIAENPETLILGVRDFSEKTTNVPFKSRFGNVMTQKILRLFCGINITDTQTGLRVFSRNLAKEFMTVPGERFEYEMNMLLRAKEKNIKIKEVAIKTIYIKNNKTSHFDPLLDSLKIYATISKFIISAASSFIIDIAFFTLITKILYGKISSYVIVSSYLARAVSSLFNYFINKNAVFKNMESHTKTLTRYIILCVIQITLSAFLSQLLFDATHINAIVIKTVVDVILFLISFKVQRGWVFE